MVARRAIFCKSDDLKAGNIWSVRSMETVEMHSFTHTGGIVSKMITLVSKHMHIIIVSP